MRLYAVIIGALAIVLSIAVLTISTSYGFPSIIATMWALLAFLYPVPAIVAFAREHHNAIATALLNLLLGWTFLGWVAALVWSVMSKQR